MDIKQARQMLRDVGRYTLEDYKRLVDDLYNLLECDRKEIDASTLVDTGELCVTGMKVLTILEPKKGDVK